MRRTVSLSEFMPYGVPELLAARRPHLALALAAASAMAVLLFATALQLSPLFRITTPVRDWGGVIIDPPPPTPPISINQPPPPPVTPARARSRIDDGIVIPLPPTEAPSLEPPANGGQTGERAIGAGPDIGGPPHDDSGSRAESVPVLGVWNPVDELPVAITEFKPEYPYLAQQANVEGLVIVHALIGRDGHVLRVELDKKFASPLLNETALEAAKRWVFKPAIVSGQPVLFWVPIPFRFVLRL